MVCDEELRLFLGCTGERCNQESDRVSFFRKITLRAFSTIVQLLPETHSFLGLNNTILSCFSSRPLD